ncbi:hypothetical protein Y032_0168g182 [Ancylostoma ceylanicum]|uniref:Uncharacterized protein n=1 Tax=Ancylostoma ceylanicum TaxID=53326 RepID=A0A016SWE3_9BILA|nr:hypothetical protein Y032_0168g182 [Ancylostoma ceylanicum]
MEALKCFEDIPHLCIRASVILRYYPVLWDKELKFNLEAVQNDQGTCGFKAFLRASESVDEGAKHTKFDHTVHGAKDRIVYEWVLLKEYEDKFRPEMLRSNGIVRRKNILVQYNG